MMYAFINGDEITKFEPLAVVYDNGKFEFICESHNRQKHYYDHVAKTKYETFDDFLKTFSYFNVEAGTVDDKIESLLNKLRSRFMLRQVAEEEIVQQREESKDPNRRYDAALLRISKRMRTGQNER